MQPIIDPDKVNAWSASLRAAFGGSDLGLWIIIGVTLAFFVFLGITAWSVNRESKHRI